MNEFLQSGAVLILAFSLITLRLMLYAVWETFIPPLIVLSNAAILAPCSSFQCRLEVDFMTIFNILQGKQHLKSV